MERMTIACGSALAQCAWCSGNAWVCEFAHTGEPHNHGWPHGDCAGPGEPCPCCNPIASGFARERALLRETLGWLEAYGFEDKPSLFNGLIGRLRAHLCS